MRAHIHGHIQIHVHKKRKMSCNTVMLQGYQNSQSRKCHMLAKAWSTGTILYYQSGCKPVELLCKTVGQLKKLSTLLLHSVATGLLVSSQKSWNIYCEKTFTPVLSQKSSAECRRLLSLRDYWQLMLVVLFSAAVCPFIRHPCSNK